MFFGSVPIFSTFLAALRHLEFGYVGGKLGYFLWKTGLLKPFRRWFVPRFDIKQDGVTTDEELEEINRELEQKGA